MPVHFKKVCVECGTVVEQCRCWAFSKFKIPVVCEACYKEPPEMTPWENWKNDFHSIDSLVRQVHDDNTAMGWWPEDKSQLPLEVFATKISLIHSEVSEMLEGLRKGQDDDHLPQYSMEAVEAADILIRLLDYCGARNINLGEVTMHKMLYNQGREDHTAAARAAAGGKKF